MRERFSKIMFGEKFIPPSKEGIWYIGTGGGALWGGNAVDPDGILYQNVNEIPTDLQMIDILDQMKESASRGNSLYLQHCSSCHGPERAGNGLDIPNLQGISKKLDRSDVSDLLTSGRGRMPTFQHLRGSEKRAIIDFIFNEESNNTLDNEIHGNADVATNQPDKEFPYVPPYIQTGYNKVRDAQGYPGIKPPWGTLNAVDLNTGELLWRVPLGEIDELSERGIPVTGTHTFGGPIVTHGDLIFIAATEDLKIRAYDKNSGNTLWEHKLPKRGSATPITYAVDGKQYVVIAAGGYNRTGTPSVAESQYIAFSLP
jgi:quinoprotein glucose dehydrogenase